jgi:hypothetical protein
MKQYRDELRDCLSRLAAPADQQTKYLQEIGVYPSADELALELHELVLLADSKLQEGEIAKSERDEIAGLDSKLAAISGPENASLWTAEALSSVPEWKEVRNLAKECLRLIEMSRQGPTSK